MLSTIRGVTDDQPTSVNTTDMVINGIHYNATVLKYWNYTLYENHTLSNNSKCWLVFDQYQPVMLPDGVFINGTSCYTPVLPLGTRGRLGLAFGSLFCLSLFITLIQLKKLGHQFLRGEKRSRMAGRRWQWYWMIIAAACGMISSITGIDVDRNYLQELPLLLQCFFFVMIGQATVAAVWEGVRHWGSWQESQMVDQDPFSLPQDDKRSRTEFHMPLVFYFFTFMSFFLTAPRSWSRITKQGGSTQQNSIAEPQATDSRFKAGAVLLCISWCVIIYCVQHNIVHYRLRANQSQPIDPARRSLFSIVKSIRHLPIRFTLSIFIIAIYVFYGVAAAWNFDISIMKYNVWPGWPFILAYTPFILVLLILGISGFFQVNEDQQLIKQRIDRGQRVNQELGIVFKPNWWSKFRGDGHLDDLSRLRGLVADTNITSHKRHSTVRNSLTPTPNMLELAQLGNSGPLRDRSDALANPISSIYPTSTHHQASPLYTDSSAGTTPMGDLVFTQETLPPPPYVARDSSLSLSSTNIRTTNTNIGQKQQIRSMLDA